MHTCNNLVVTCMDFRFQSAINLYLNQMGIEDDYDRVSYAGSSKNLINIIGQVALSNKLHGAVNIHIFHHEDCGAYGLDLAKVSKEDEILLHKKDMSCAEMEILKIIPTAKVSHYFVSLDKKVIKL